MKNTYVYSWNEVSNGARELASALGIRRVRHEGSGFKGASWKTVINWGSSSLPREVLRCSVLNKPDVVARAANKLSFFKLMTDAPVSDRSRVVPWTSDKKVVSEWLSKGFSVVARTILTGHSGNGIIIVERGSDIPPAQLYTQYVSKSHEFRIHVMKGKVIDVQRKIRDPDREPGNWKVRSHDNGFIYVRQGFETPRDVLEQSGKALLVSGLDFGAVDVVYSAKQGKAYVLEVNCAPGLEGSSVGNYAEAFKSLLGSISKNSVRA